MSISKWFFSNAICLFPLLLFSFSLLAVDLSDFPPCDSQACQSVAAIEKWPKSNNTKSEKINFHNFTLSIPLNSTITRSNKFFRQFEYDEKRSLSLSIYQRSDMDDLFKASRYTMLDWADIVFTQTPNDATPETKEEAFAWYVTLMSKVVFVGGNMVTQYTNMPYVVYLINDHFTGNNVLMIVSKNLPKVLLKVEITGFEHLAVKKLIASVSKMP